MQLNQVVTLLRIVTPRFVSIRNTFYAHMPKKLSLTNQNQSATLAAYVSAIIINLLIIQPIITIPYRMTTTELQIIPEIPETWEDIVDCSHDNNKKNYRATETKIYPSSLS